MWDRNDNEHFFKARSEVEGIPMFKIRLPNQGSSCDPRVKTDRVPNPKPKRYNTGRAFMVIPTCS